MATLSVAGQDILSFAEAWVASPYYPDPGTYYAHGDLGNAPHEGPALYDELMISFPGVDGVGVKRMGFRGRMIRFRLLFVGESKTDVETRKNAFFALVTPLASFSVTVPGGTARPSCRIVQGSGQDGSWLYMGGKMVLAVDVEVKQLRET